MMGHMANFSIDSVLKHLLDPQPVGVRSQLTNFYRWKKIPF